MGLDPLEHMRVVAEHHRGPGLDQPAVAAHQLGRRPVVVLHPLVHRDKDDVGLFRGRPHRRHRRPLLEAGHAGIIAQGEEGDALRVARHPEMDRVPAAAGPGPVERAPGRIQPAQVRLGVGDTRRTGIGHVVVGQRKQVETGPHHLVERGGRRVEGVHLLQHR